MKTTMEVLHTLFYVMGAIQLWLTAVFASDLGEALLWKRMYSSAEWWFAREQMETWCHNGKLPYMRYSSRRRLLKIACSGWASEQRIKRLALVSGPNGWAIFQMLLARHPIRRRLLNWRY